MKIQLVDHNAEMCHQWNLNFRGCGDVVVHHGDFFSLPTDCVVSPANSFGFMDGNLDYIITQKLGPYAQEALQAKIRSNPMGELLVGQALIVETNNEEVPYVISAPTMRVPMELRGSVNVFLAMKAALICFKASNLETLTISGLGTGAGKVPYDICAKQMKSAYDWVNYTQTNSMVYPTSWQQAQDDHNWLIKRP